MSTAEMFSDGAAYEKLMGRWSRKVGDEFLPWVDPPDGQRWLDAGCGTGVFTEEIVARCRPAAVVGIDPSAEQIAYAKARSAAAGAEFRVGDAQAMPFPDAGFDVAVMALVLHFLPDPPKALSEIARVLRPGGVAASYVWDYVSDASPTAPFYAALKSLGIPYTSPPSAQATALPVQAGLWERAGFTDVETRVIRIEVGFPDFAAFWDSMSQPVGPVGKALAQMPLERREALRLRLQETTVRPDGSVAYEAVANAIKGRKPG